MSVLPATLVALKLVAPPGSSRSSGAVPTSDSVPPANPEMLSVTPSSAMVEP